MNTGHAYSEYLPMSISPTCLFYMIMQSPYILVTVRSLSQRSPVIVPNVSKNDLDKVYNLLVLIKCHIQSVDSQ